MIPLPSAGVQPRGHPLRVVNNGSGNPELPQHVVAQSDGDVSQPLFRPQQQQPQPQPQVIDLTTSSAGETTTSHDKEPPAKRQRLEMPPGVSSGAASPAPSVGSGTGSGSGELRSGAPGATGTPRPPSTTWRGRPVWSFQSLLSDAPGGAAAAAAGGDRDRDPNGESAAALAQGGKPASPPPMPVPPWKHVAQEPEESHKTSDSLPVKKVETTPYRIETPSVAPEIKGDKVADFWPWTGNHPEDVLNEQTAKQGYYDHTQVSQNESNTARPSLYAQLKHRSGLQVLSSIFALALEKRQNHNAIATPSTFKPPPRVTLTDNKREAWLRDLANPSVPLRRLSRTIPHGIRGKVLLDQCLSKWVPVARAIWLAKCVGANEIRAFKRKGTSGALAVGLEAKWVREWTVNVQQFLESVLSSCGTAEWKTKMTYAVSLTARLFHEHLLDHDYYIGWFLSSLEAASVKTLPIWLLMLGIYWTNIMRYRKRGHRLTEILLQRQRQINDFGQIESLRPLKDRLDLFVKKLVHQHTSSVILPTSWATYKDLVSSSLDLENKVDRVIFQNLAERNVRVQQPMENQRTHKRSTQQQQQYIIRLLDSIHSAHDIPSVSVSCLDSSEDRKTLVYKLLEWTATPFRHGLHRVYIAVRLLRKWKLSGVDVDAHVLAFLGDCPKAKENMENIYHVISELVRSQTFPVGKYLQWLVAKGVTGADDSGAGQSNDMSGGVGLLTQLPVSHLPEHIRNFRDTLLVRVGIAPSGEATTIATVRDSISRRLPRVFGVEQLDDTFDLSYQGLTWAVKSEIGQWIRRAVIQHCREPVKKIPGATFLNESKVSALTADEFYQIRGILESFGDLSMLADVVKQASSSDDNTVLASAVDTVNYHCDSFSVIGATGDLFRKLFEACSLLKRLGTADLDLIYSLIELGLQLPNESTAVTYLRQDLSRIEHKSAQAAPSPLSDHIPDSLTETDTKFYEKLDQFMSSGSGMDEPTMETIFDALVKVLDSGDSQTKLSANEACRYLAHLRLFNPKHFDIRLVRWVWGVLVSSNRQRLSKTLPPLIGVGCVTIPTFLALVKKLQQSKQASSTIPRMAELQMDLFELLVPPALDDNRYSDLVTYRFYLAQQEFRTKNLEETFDIIRGAATSIDQQPDEGPDSRRDHLATCMTNLLCELFTIHPESAAQQCMQKLPEQHPAFLAALQNALDRLLGLDSHAGQITDNLTGAEKVISMTGDFSLPFCQLKLQILFNTGSGEEVKDGVLDVLFNTAVADSRLNRTNWVGLVGLLNQDAVRQIRERAEKELLSVPILENLADDKSSSAPSSYSGSLETARVCLTIIEELAHSVPDAGVPSIAPLLVEKMDTLLHKLVVMQTNFASFSGNKGDSAGDPAANTRLNFERGLAFWFSVLLRMAVIHRSAFMAPSSSSTAPKPNALHDQSRILISIFCISLARFPGNLLRHFPAADYFPHRPMQPNEYRPCPGILLQTHALDVAASLIDAFPDEARNNCARFLKEKCPPFAQFQNDPRFVYLLGPIPGGIAHTNASQQAALSSASVPSPAASASAPTPTPTPSSASQQPPSSSTVATETSNSISGHLRLQHHGRTVGTYPIRPWELLEDAAPLAGVNDTAISLRYFDARRVKA